MKKVTIIVSLGGPASASEIAAELRAQADVLAAPVISAGPTAEAEEVKEEKEEKPAKAKKGKKAAKVETPAEPAEDEDFDLEDEEEEEGGEDDLDLGDEDEDEEEAHTLEDVIGAFQKYAKKHSREKAAKVLSKFKVKSVRELKPAQYGEVMSAITR